MQFIIYDLEATCWRGRPPNGVNEIIEIGAYKMNPYGEIVDVFNSFIKPVVNPFLSSFCTELTTITQNQVNRADPFPKVIDRFQDWIDVYNDYLLCSWGKFDKQLLRSDCDLHKLESDWLEEHINLKAQYHEIKKMNKYTGLQSTIKREGFEFEGVHHRAISDAENLTKIFCKYIDEWQF